MDVKNLIRIFSHPGEGDSNACRPIALDVRTKGQPMVRKATHSPTDTRDTSYTSRVNASIYKRVEAIVMRMLHTERGLPLKSYRSLFRSGLENAFTGADLILWLILDLGIPNKVEALHLAYMISHLGYMYPIDKAQLGQPVKEDGTLYRLQTSRYWPSQIKGELEFKYAVFLVRKLIPSKSRLKILDHELDEMETMRDVSFKHQWNRVICMAKDEFLVLHQQKKSTRLTMEAQETSFWFCQKPPPPFHPASDMMLSLVGIPLSSHEQPNTSESLHGEIEFLKENLIKHRVNMSTALKNLTTNCQRYVEFDPFLVQPFPSNPWITGSTMFWSYKASFFEHAHTTRVKQWGYSLDELLNNKVGRAVFEEFCKKQCCAENIRFWCACDNLHSVPLSTIPFEVHHIYQEFMAEDCPNEINISAEIKKNCDKDILSPDRYAFTKAKNQVYFLMKEDIYPRFVKSDQYKMLLKPQMGDTGLLAFGRGLFSRLRRSRYGQNSGRNSTSPTNSSYMLPTRRRSSGFGIGIKASSSLDSLQVIGSGGAGDTDLFIRSLMKPCSNSSSSSTLSSHEQAAAAMALAMPVKSWPAPKLAQLVYQDSPRRRVSAPTPPILVHSTDGTTMVLETTAEESAAAVAMVNGTDDLNALLPPKSPSTTDLLRQPLDVEQLGLLSGSLDSMVVDSGTLKRRAKTFATYDSDENSSEPEPEPEVDLANHNHSSSQTAQKSNTLPEKASSSMLSPWFPTNTIQSSSASSISTGSAYSLPAAMTTPQPISRPNSDTELTNYRRGYATAEEVGSKRSLQ